MEVIRSTVPYNGGLTSKKQSDRLPKLIEKPSLAGLKNNNPKMIIVHAMAEYLDMKDAPVFASDFLESMGYSAHLLILPNGDKIKCRENNQGAFHARGFNENSLGIEFPHFLID